MHTKKKKYWNGREELKKYIFLKTKIVKIQNILNFAVMKTTNMNTIKQSFNKIISGTWTFM